MSRSLGALAQRVLHEVEHDQRDHLAATAQRVLAFTPPVDLAATRVACPVYGAAYMWFDVDGAWTRPE